MRLLNTIRALFRSRRAAGGKVRPQPTDHDVMGPYTITVGGPTGTYQVAGGPFDGQTRTDVHLDLDGLHHEHRDVQDGFMARREIVVHRRVLTRDGRLELQYVETQEAYGTSQGLVRYRRTDR